MPPSPATWHALIRTHHITSRAKVSKLKQAATKHGVFVLLRSGGAPGMMYVAGEARGNVEEWVGVVQVSEIDFVLWMRGFIIDWILG